MGLFSSLFGNPTSDTASKARQNALNAFNAIKTPDLSALQVQLSNYVNQGKLTPQQAETELMSSNAFNDIKTDPSLTGAQKMALTQLQQIGTQGGMTAIDKAQLMDIQNQQNQANRSQNAATIQQAQERGMGNAGLTTVNQLINEQGNADRAAMAGTQVAANAQQRALQALQAAGQQGGAMEAQQYGEQANKANAGNAIEQFNTQNQNAMNLENARTANAAQQANLANAQNVANANTSTANTQAQLNAQAAQKQYEDALQKAQGIAGVEQNAATAAQQTQNAETGANAGLLSGLIGTGAKVLGTIYGGPVGGAVAGTVADSLTKDNSGGFNSGSVNPYQSQKINPNATFADGGEVIPTSPIDHTTITPKDVNDFQIFLAEFKPKKMAYGGSVDHDCMSHGEEVCMNKGGKTPHFLEGLKKGALHKNLGVPSDKPIPSGKLEKATHSDNETVRKRAQFAENAKHWKHSDGGEIGYDDGGMVDSSTSTINVPITPPIQNKKVQPSFADRITSLLTKNATASNDIDKNQGGEIKDFRDGGSVPGIPKVSGDSPINDTVPAKLSPGEVVLPRTVVKNPERIPSFVEKSTHPNPNHISAALHSLMNPKKERI